MYFIKKVVPGFEPGSLDSKSNVLTITLYNHHDILAHSKNDITSIYNILFKRIFSEFLDLLEYYLVVFRLVSVVFKVVGNN